MSTKHSFGLHMTYIMSEKTLLLIIALCFSSFPAMAWEAIDGDTIAIPQERVYDIIKDMPLSIRLRGVDTPEIKSKCAEERLAAERAKVFTRDAIRQAKNIRLENTEWDKYGGRIDADMYLDGVSLARLLIDHGLGRPYNGGQKKKWCDKKLLTDTQKHLS